VRVSARSGPGLPDGDLNRRLAASRSARLATVRADGTPHIVPVTFAVAGEVLVTAVDAKPKRTSDLQRLRNLRANPAFSLIVDAYDDDWSQLWWVRLDGTARIVTDEPARTAAVAPLVGKYRQYRTDPPAGAAIVLTPRRWVSWSGAPAG
jgi:PPOX class probable F420-dependent enzyme